MLQILFFDFTFFDFTETLDSKGILHTLKEVLHQPHNPPDAEITQLELFNFAM